MENKKIIVKSGSLLPVLFLVFLVMKLAEIGKVATWSWWWVAAPLWIPVAIVVFTLIVWVVMYMIFNRKK